MMLKTDLEVDWIFSFSKIITFSRENPRFAGKSEGTYSRALPDTLAKYQIGIWPKQFQRDLCRMVFPEGETVFLLFLNN